MNKPYVRSLMDVSLARALERIRREEAVRPLRATERRDLALLEAEQRRREQRASEAEYAHPERS